METLHINSNINFKCAALNITAKKIKFPMKDFFGKCKMFKKCLMKNFICCAVYTLMTREL